MNTEKEHKTDGTPCWCNPKIVKVLSKEQEELVEKLADIEHQRWADWQKYVFDKCKTQDSGRGVGKPFDLIIPSELVEHWQRQINTPYSELSEEEKALRGYRCKDSVYKWVERQACFA